MAVRSVQGTARGGWSPGYSYLTEDRRLAQGSKPPPGVRSLPFDTIVLAAREYQPELPGYDVIYVPLDDVNDPPPSAFDRMRIRDVALEVADRIRMGRRVLVTCYQGRNRSGVIAGLALVYLGVPRAEAARKIRHLRNGLTNPHFYRMVLGSGHARNRSGR